MTTNNTSTVASLEEFIDSRYESMGGEISSTPKQGSSAKQGDGDVLDDSTSMTDSISFWVPVSGNAVSDVNNAGNSHEGASQTLLPSGMLSQISHSLSGQKTKKRKKISPLKEYKQQNLSKLENLSEDEKRVAGSVLESLLTMVSDHLSLFKDKLTSQFETAMERQQDAMDLVLNRQTTEMEMMAEELKTVKDQLMITEGRLTRAEKQVDDLREQLLVTEARSMRDNLMFYNIPEDNTLGKDMESTLRAFLREEMSISDEDMKSISFDRVHRIGAKRAQWSRPIVAKFTTSKGKDIVLRHTKNLRRDKNFGVNEQLPRELEERKKQLLPKYKEARREQRKPKWSLDKLVVGNQVTEVKRDGIKDINVNTTEIAASMDVSHTPPMTHNSTSFQGHSTVIKSQDDIVPALHAMYADSRVARANHNMYAYRIQVGSTVTEHYEDDREWGAGRQLLKLLKDHNITNKIVCVSRWNGGSNLGRARFDHILKAAKLTLQIEDQ